MSYRAIAVSPLLFLLLSLAAVGLAPEAARPEVRHALVELVKAAALVGCAAGALAYAPGDYLRVGWGLTACCYLLLLSRDAWIAFAPAAPSPAVEALHVLIITAANACGVYGTWRLARAWHVAGFEHPGPAFARRAVVAAAVLASLVFAGPSLFVDLRAALSGVPGSYWTVPSDLGDLLALPLVAPVALTALAVRGGALRWPWGLLTASLLAWLLYDAVLTIPELIAVDPTGYRPVAECFRLLAGAFACAAGFAQRRVVRELG